MYNLLRALDRATFNLLTSAKNLNEPIVLVKLNLPQGLAPVGAS